MAGRTCGEINLRISLPSLIQKHERDRRTDKRTDGYRTEDFLVSFLSASLYFSKRGAY